MSLPPHARDAVGWWLLGSAAAVFVMIGIGGVTRLTRSGLSMTEWKFTGERWPSSQARRPAVRRQEHLLAMLSVYKQTSSVSL